MMFWIVEPRDQQHRQKEDRLGDDVQPQAMYCVPIDVVERAQFPPSSSTPMNSPMTISQL